jgi:hypothetical protein
MSFCSGSSGVAGYGPRSRVSSRTRASITEKATAPAMTFSRRRMFGCWNALRWMTRYVLDCARWYAGPVDSVGLKLEATWFPSDEHMPSAARHTASGTPCPSSISARWFRWCRPDAVCATFWPTRLGGLNASTSHSGRTRQSTEFSDRSPGMRCPRRSARSARASIRE